jgi:hypothetical protein
MKLFFSDPRHPSEPQEWGEHKRVEKFFDVGALNSQLSARLDSEHGDVLVSGTAFRPWSPRMF